MKDKSELIDTLLVPLFVQARQEALKEADELRATGGIVISSPSKVNHLVKEAKATLQKAFREVEIEALTHHISDLTYAVGYTQGLGTQGIGDSKGHPFLVKQLELANDRLSELTKIKEDEDDE